jgi:hypothetical protein
MMMLMMLRTVASSRAKAQTPESLCSRRIGGLPAKRKKESRRQQLSLAYSFVLSDA